ncbi:DegT/DnrJ/EryC1/StrS family aminotransferase [Pelagibacteraceae bacterium]|nr:DegT/DnrJ/EryC1/StrS family aminotransferase [Pelagibacteraceae bacterium]
MKKFKLADSTIGNSDYRLMISFLKKKKYLNQSIVTEKFQNSFSKFLGRKKSIFVNSGSSANLLIAQVLLEGNFLKNKTVVLPAVSWSTTVSPFLQLGYKIILCDCDKKSLGIDTVQLEKICKKYKPALLGIVNVLGHGNDNKKILSLQKKYNFQIIEDNCESLGSRNKSKKLGTLGLASSHSFYYGHHISTIEGGMVSTNNNKFYNLSLAIRAHGWSRNVEKKFKKKLERKYKVNEFESLYTFYYSGFNIRSTDFNATIGLNQIKKIKKLSITRHKNFNYYKKELDKFWCQESKLDVVSSFGYATFVSNRLDVYKYLKSKKIECRPLICGNIHNQPFWKNKKNQSSVLKNANFVHKNGLYLPNHGKLNKDHIKYISTNFKLIAKPIFFQK